MIRIKILCTTFLLFLFEAQAARPKLVVVLVIDQFRSDNISRYESRFLPANDKTGKLGGFNYLLKKGAYFPLAQFNILQPMTGPGHATILSGTYPYLGGIPLNHWYNPETKEILYCVEDTNFETVGKSSSKKHLGTSPRNFLGTTIGDELKNAGWGSKVVSIALKDRSAILLGGQRADLALWMDPSSQTWVSSSYYLKDKKLPNWVEKINSNLLAKRGETFLWEQSSLPDTSLAISNIHREGPYVKALGDSFPHTITRGTVSELASPEGLEITVAAAEKAVEELNLGKSNGPDLLAISFSSHDYVGHGFGPNSRENEEMVVAEDKMLSRLFMFLARKVPGGLKNVLFALTADHGVAPNAQWLIANQINAGVVDPEELEKRMETKLEEKFGSIKNYPWISYSEAFNFWINKEALEKKKISLEVVALELKQLLIKEKAFATAFTFNEVSTRQLPPGIFEKRILNTYVSKRSGDIIGLVRPFFYDKEHTTSHMAPYSYDETVPLILAGEGIVPGKYGSNAQVIDLAPTLSFLLDIIPPSLSEGRVLAEILPVPKKL